MYKNIFGLLAWCLLIIGCQSQQDSGDADASLPVADSSATEPLYPYPQYLAAQLAYIDSTPLGIECTVREKDIIIDSSFVDKATFKQAVAFFTDIDPNTINIRHWYKETSFNDLSTEAVTFSIQSTNDTLPLQKVQVLLHPETQKVKSVILQLQQQQGDTSIVSNVLWQHNMKCQIARSYTLGNGQTFTRITTFVWDKPL